MIISRTPLRISLLGGGTDYPEWFMSHGGAVMVTAIDKYVWVMFSEGKVTSSCDLPAQSGLATSSAQTVGLLKILAELKSEGSDSESISQFATFVERDKLAGNVGFQDQYICSKGGFRLIRFSELGIRDVELNVDWLEPYLMLFHTQQKRKKAGSIVVSQLEEMTNHTELYFGLMKLVEEGLDALKAKDWEWFGNILHESWVVKRGLSNKITTEAIDQIYNAGLKAGAIGGKLLGSGGGGSMLFLAHPSKQEDIKNAISQCWHIPFKFEKEGARIVLRND